MKPYIHNPAVFHKHFVGQGLPAFRGARVQRGRGILTSKLKRFAVPLLQAGASTAAPYISKAAGKIATHAARQFFPGNYGAQKMAGKVASKVTGSVINSLTGRVQKKRKRSVASRRSTKRKATTPARAPQHKIKRRAASLLNIFA